MSPSQFFQPLRKPDRTSPCSRRGRRDILCALTPSSSLSFPLSHIPSFPLYRPTDWRHTQRLPRKTKCTFCTSSLVRVFALPPLFVSFLIESPLSCCSESVFSFCWCPLPSPLPSVCLSFLRACLFFFPTPSLALSSPFSCSCSLSRRLLLFLGLSSPCYASGTALQSDPPTAVFLTAQSPPSLAWPCPATRNQSRPEK